MKWSKLITATMIGSMILAQLPAGFSEQVAAATKTESVSSEETVKASKEETQEDIMYRVLVDLKKRITIPDEYETFQYSCDDYSDQLNPRWYFQWYPKDGGGEIYVTCDSKGHIYSYRKYSYDSNRKIPTYLKDELTSKVKQFLKKAFKDYYGELKLTSVDYISWYNNCYNYTFERYINEIAVPDNSVTISVNASTGEIMSFNPSWNYDVSFDSTSKIISKDKADEILKNGLSMELEYHLVTSEDGKKMTGELIYVPNESYLAVDAFDGTLYDSRSYAYSNEYDYKTEESAAADMAANGMYDQGVLTQEEIAKIEELAGLLTKKQAAKKVTSNSYLFVDKDITLQSASLYESVLDSSKPEEKQYVWNLNFRNTKEPDYSLNYYYEPYTNARVDAKTGEILSLYSSTKQYQWGVDVNSIDMVCNLEEGLEIAKDFLNKYCKELYSQTEYTDADNGYIIAYQEDDAQVGGSVYTFTRVKDGVKVPQNEITVAVDWVTGKIYEYNYSWCKAVEFESKSNVINASTAKDNYLACEGYDLVYEICEDKIDEIDTVYSRLVYRTEIYPYYIDALTGKQVYYDGMEYKKEAEISKYTDISGSPYRREIELLADMGMGFEGGRFEPSKAITKAELDQFLASANISFILQQDTSDTTLTREEAAKYVISALNLNRIADFDIYRSIYTDGDKIASENLGYVLLADQLGYLVADSNHCIHAKDLLTREQVAIMVYRLLMTSVEGF